VSTDLPDRPENRPDRDPLDAPEEVDFELAVPFVVCTSQGGPYDDAAFVAGFYTGSVDRALQVGKVAEAPVVQAVVPSTLLNQLELIGMHRGYPTMRTRVSDDPAWTYVQFMAVGAAGQLL
jgi:hypothetical protein